MFKSRLSRISFLIAALGAIVLSASAFIWKQTDSTNEFFSETHTYKWVHYTQQKGKSFGRDLHYFVTGKCVNNVIRLRLARAKIDLDAHLATEPQELKDFANRRKTEDNLPTNESDRRDYLLKKRRQDSEDVQAHLYLMNKYNNWFSMKSQLEYRVQELEKSSAISEDMSFMLSEIKKSIFANTPEEFVAARYSVVFGAREKQTLEKDCIAKVPIVRVIDETIAVNNINRWLQESIIAWMGVALLAVGLVFGPAIGWVRSGS